MMEGTYFSRLPPDLRNIVLPNYITPRVLIELAQTNPRYKELVENQETWRRFLQRDFNYVYSGPGEHLGTIYFLIERGLRPSTVSYLSRLKLDEFLYRIDPLAIESVRDDSSPGKPNYYISFSFPDRGVNVFFQYGNTSDSQFPSKMTFYRANRPTFFEYSPHQNRRTSNPSAALWEVYDSFMNSEVPTYDNLLQIVSRIGNARISRPPSGLYIEIPFQYWISARY